MILPWYMSKNMVLIWTTARKEKSMCIVVHAVQYVTYNPVLWFKILNCFSWKPYKVNTTKISSFVDLRINGGLQYFLVSLIKLQCYLILSAVVQFPVLGLFGARKSTRMSAYDDKMLTLIMSPRLPADGQWALVLSWPDSVNLMLSCQRPASRTQTHTRVEFISALTLVRFKWRPSGNTEL